MSLASGARPRIVRAVGAEVLGQALNIGVRIALVPLFLSAWGARAYGEWLILTAVAAWFGLADLGGQMYFVNRLTEAWTAGRRDEFQRVFSTGLLALLIMSAVLFASVVTGLACLPSLSWLKLQVVTPDAAKLILSVTALRFLVALPVGILLGVYRATEAQATSVMFANLALVLQFAGSVVALLAGAGMLVIAAVDVAALLAVAVLVSVDLRRRLPADIRLFSPGFADRSVLRECVSPSLHFLSIQLAMAVMIQGSVLVVAEALGPVLVAVFSTMRTVSNMVSRLLAMLSHSAWPEFTRLATTDRTEPLARLFKSILLLGLLSGLLYLVFLRGFGAALFDWWLNRTLVYEPATMFLMGCLVIVTTLWTFGGTLLMATTRHEEYARAQLPVNVFALWLCHQGASAYGLFGAVLGLFAGQSVLMTGIVVVLLRRHGLGQAATGLFRVSVGSLALLPMCLNPWSGLAAIALVTALAARQFQWRDFSCLPARTP